MAVVHLLALIPATFAAFYGFLLFVATIGNVNSMQDVESIGFAGSLAMILSGGVMLLGVINWFFVLHTYLGTANYRSLVLKMSGGMVGLVAVYSILDWLAANGRFAFGFEYWCLTACLILLGLCFFCVGSGYDVLHQRLASGLDKILIGCGFLTSAILIVFSMVAMSQLFRLASAQIVEREKAPIAFWLLELFAGPEPDAARGFQVVQFFLLNTLCCGVVLILFSTYAGLAFVIRRQRIANEQNGQNGQDS